MIPAGILALHGAKRPQSALLLSSLCHLKITVKSSQARHSTTRRRSSKTTNRISVRSIGLRWLKAKLINNPNSSSACEFFEFFGLKGVAKLQVLLSIKLRKRSRVRRSQSLSMTKPHHRFCAVFLINAVVVPRVRLKKLLPVATRDVWY